MQLTFESIPSIPVGQYVGRFLGFRDQPPPMPGQKGGVGRNGAVLPPGYIWEWEIIDGPERGKIADRLTGKQPTPKSACAAVAAAVSGVMFEEGRSIPFEQFVGKIYRFNMEPREMSDGTRVSVLGLARAYDIEATGRPAMGTPPANAPAPQAGPAARPGTAPAAPPPRVRKYWITRGAGMAPELVTDAELTDFVHAGADPETEECNPEGTPAWVPIAQVRPDLKRITQLPF